MKTLIVLAVLAIPGLAQAQGSPPQDSLVPQDSMAPQAKEYQGGVGSPFSNRASNISGADTQSEIAPRLPSPEANGDDARAYLMAADRALARNQTGAAQEALERAETRVLTRSTEPALANRPDTQLMARGIADARLALGQRDTAKARAVIEHMLQTR